MNKGCQGRGRHSTDEFHLPGRRGRRKGQRKTVAAAAAVDPCSVSKPHGKNEREGDTGARGHSNHGLHLPDKRQHKRRKRPRSKACWQCGHVAVGLYGLMAKAEYKHALWTSKRQQGVRMTNRTSSLAQRTHQSKVKGHTIPKTVPRKNRFESAG